MRKEIMIAPMLIMFGILLIIFAKGAYKRYQCMTSHFPDRFTEVEVYEDFQDNSLKPTNFDKGKAVYKRRYVYDSTCYHMKISQKEFNEKFYVCQDHPAKAYSESDLTRAGNQLIVAGVEFLTGISFFAGAVLICFRR